MTDNSLSPMAKLVYRELRDADSPLSRRELQRRTDEGKYAVYGGVKQLHNRGLILRERDASDLRTALYRVNGRVEAKGCLQTTDAEG